MCEVYERLIARGIITLRVASKLAPSLCKQFDVDKLNGRISTDVAVMHYCYFF